MRKYLLPLMVFLIVCKTFFGQADPNPSDYSKTIDIIPPPPNAASLGKYGGINFGLSTGTMSLSIPIYNYSSTNISLPLSISYNSNGLKVDEIGSRVGMSWTLNAGGVITRTVYGRPDETAVRVKPPAFSPYSTALISFMDVLAQSDGGTADAQPDMFSFNVNGLSGQFILDSNQNAILLSHADLKIETYLNSLSSTFKITTADGIQYFFGGDSAVETTSKTNLGSGCGKGTFTGVPTAFYLKKIVHPNNDTVNFVYSRFGFTYKTGTTETIYGFNPNEVIQCPGGQADPPVFSNTTCMSIYTTSGVLLEEINSTAGGAVKFSYVSRLDDGDELLSKIEIYQPLNVTPFRVFSLGYQNSVATNFLNSYSSSDASLKYRPFLTQFIERSPDSSLTKTYQFAYNDINGLPPRLSFAQDDYGIFNGKNNLTLIPKPDYLTWQDNLPQATANRAVDPTYGIKGLLSKIIYPTGGTDTINYESNTVYASVPVPLPDSIILATVNSGPLGGPLEIAYSDTAFITTGQETHLYASCAYTGPPNEYDPVHCTGTVEVIDLTSGLTVYGSTTLSCGTTLSPPIISLQSGHSYRIKVTAGGHYSEVNASLTYKYGSQAYQTINKEVGGIRVKKVITTDSVSLTPSTKKYIYANLNTQNQSSGGIIYQPRYDKYLTAYVNCPPSGGFPSCYFASFYFYSMFSYSQANVYAYSSAPVSYSSVIESFGENFENGGIEHQYTVMPDDQGTSIFGQNIIASQGSSNAWKNGREYYQQVFKKIGTDYIPLKKAYTNFKDDSRIDTSFAGYIVNKRYASVCYTDPPDQVQIDAYDLFKYYIFRKWTYVDTVRTLTYDNAGQNYLADTAVTEYANVNHAFPTKTYARNSNGKLGIVNNYYPQDITLSGAEETGRLALITKHITSPKLQIQVLEDTAQVMKAKINYNVFPNGLVLPKEQYVQTHNNSLEKRIEFYKYNSFGKILEQAKASDVKLNYIFDYNSLYPIAEVKNADSLNIAYTSFEADGKGNWAFSGTSSTDNSAPSGNKCYSLSGGSISKTGLSTSGNYIVSYWSKNGQQGVSGSESAITGRTLGAWTYYEHPVSNPSGGTITISGSGTIDELRLYPKGSFMTTYTYEPLIGLSSVCDVNNRMTYYEYDKLGRLSIVRDQDKNITKRICYNYAGQAENCLIFFNIAKSGNFTRNNCAAGGTGSVVTYTVPANTYSSNTSQAAADQLAQNDVNANGQTYANNNGTCTFYNVVKSGNFTRNNCAAGGTGSVVTYTVPANTYSSTTSQAAADQLAQNDVTANGQTYANNNGTCTFYNVVKSGNFTRNNCAAGGTGSTVTYTVPANTYSSTTSQAAADQLAQNDVNANGQAYANNNGTCTFYNVVKSGNFTRNNCGSGYIGSTVTYTVPANTYSSTTSQAAADQLAQNDVDANGQAYANTNGTCTVLTIYAKIVLTDIYNDVGYSTANIWIKFYSDVNCTVPVSVSGLNVNYKKVRTLCSGGSPLTTNYTQNNCSGTQVLVGEGFIISSDDGIHCYNYTFSTTSGTGYTPK